MILGEIKFIVIFASKHNRSRMKQQFSAMQLEDA